MHRDITTTANNTTAQYALDAFRMECKVMADIYTIKPIVKGYTRAQKAQRVAIAWGMLVCSVVGMIVAISL